MVAVCDEKGAEFARGLANYGAEDMRKIMGLKTAAIHGLFGDHAYDEAIHRDHLVLSE
jgi:glutamate 5-kinase